MAELVRRAADVVDPDAADSAVVALVERFEDRDELDDDRETLLRLAARAELPAEPEPSVAGWLAAQGIEV